MASGESHEGVRVALLPEAIAAIMSRLFVSDVLEQWHMLDTVQDAEAVVTELVSNAAAASTSADTDVTVGLRVEQGSLLIEVGDQTEGLPALRHPALEDSRSLHRGLDEPTVGCSPADRPEARLVGTDL
ncbi:hypothetical protein ABZ608_23010 [Streptomyces sp. NPDC013172]|uniref:hypothetical protein n=1 Tax=Streptomyces sp. NPDC013172 TaxID=3155009 RepID=UPI0033CBA864